MHGPNKNEKVSSYIWHRFVETNLLNDYNSLEHALRIEYTRLYSYCNGIKLQSDIQNALYFLLNKRSKSRIYTKKKKKYFLPFCFS